MKCRNYILCHSYDRISPFQAPWAARPIDGRSLSSLHHSLHWLQCTAQKQPIPSYYGILVYWHVAMLVQHIVERTVSFIHYSWHGLVYLVCVVWHHGLVGYVSDSKDVWRVRGAFRSYVHLCVLCKEKDEAHVRGFHLNLIPTSKLATLYAAKMGWLKYNNLLAAF